MEEKLLLSPAELASSLGLGRTKVFELMQNGQLESCTIGRRRVVPVEALANFVTRLRDEQAVKE